MSVLHATVIGTVQGVGFRWYVKGRALRFGLTGSAKNRPDGSVEVVAEGPPAALARLLAALPEGPGRVDRVEQVISEGTLDLDTFTIW
jgi:acylphosphatase